MVFNSINKCAMDVRKSLYGSIVLSGASTMFPGYASRIKNEVKNIYTKKNLALSADKTIKINIKIIDSPRRKYSVFSGAAILATTYNKDNNIAYWISKKEWEEFGGEKIILKKCQNILR